jgi:hypothetical protein
MPSSDHAPVLLALQQTHGNQYVQRVVTGIQAKLKVGQPGDKYEQEADRIAEEVMRMPEPEVQRQPEEEEEEELIQTKPLADPITPLIQRQVEEKEEEEEEEILQTKENPGQTPEVTPDFESRIQSLKSSGQSLAEADRGFMEKRFGTDFSDVRLHTESNAAEINRGLNAEAFTYGRDIYFGTGKYNLRTSSGKRLLAHELTHLVQQRAVNSPIKPQTVINQTVKKSHNALTYIPSVQEIEVMRVKTTQINQNNRVFRYPLFEEYESGESEERPRLGPGSRGTLSYREAIELLERTTPLPTPEERLADELENYHGLNGWHLRLLPSTIQAPITIGQGRARTRSHPGTPPPITGGYPQTPTLVPINNDPRLSAARDILLTRMRRRVNDIEIPTGYRRTVVSGGQTVERRALPVHFRGSRGFVYSARSWEQGGDYSTLVGEHHPVAERHTQFERSATLQTIGYQNPIPRIEGLWTIFQWVLGHEGDVPAINAWDEQILTIGAGFSARTGDVGAIYRRMPDQFHRDLYRYGIRIADDNSFIVLDLQRGVFETGDRALRLLQVDEQRLGVLIRAAMSPQDISHQGLYLEQRAWMMRAQFEQFMVRNADVSNAVLSWSPRARVIFPFILKHWAGSLSWAEIASRGPDPRRIASYARDRIHRARADWTLEYIESRIQGLATDAGLGSVF